MPLLSVVVITYNEEKNIERCLRSLSWADEIIVVDSFSNDKTLEIVKRYTEKIILSKYDGDIPQRQRGFAQARGDWLLWIDADEEVSDELRDEILGVINLPDAKDGYYVSRKIWAFGKWIKYGGWSPDWQFRLVRNGREMIEYQEVHGGFTTHGSKGKLCKPLYHYTYANISEYIRKMNEHTSLHVSNKLRKKPSVKVGWHKIVFSPLSHFIRKYVMQKGYKDGIVGFILAVLGSLYTLALYAKLWEYRYRQRRGEPLPPITNIELQQYKMRYH